MIASMAQSRAENQQVEVMFLKPNEKYKSEKPYGFKFPRSSGDVPPSNTEHEHRGIDLTDMRGSESLFSLATHGFAIFNQENELSYDDLHTEAGLATYFRYLEVLLKNHLGARDVKYFRHGIRKRHPEFPYPTGEMYQFEQPATAVHVDTTIREACVEVERQEGDKAHELLKKRFQWVNIWKPLRGPLKDWPLAVCDASTVDGEVDLEPSDLIYPHFATENAGVYYKPGFKWYYLNNHKTSELLVFIQADSMLGSLPGVPHCSFPNPLSPKEEPLRESIEVRLLVYYD